MTTAPSPTARSTTAASATPSPPSAASTGVLDPPVGSYSPPAGTAGEPTSPLPQSAQAEDFAGQPSDVLLTYAQTVDPNVTSRCVGLNASGAGEGFGGVDQGPTPQTVRLELVPGAAMPTQARCPASAGGTDTLSVLPAPPSSGGVVSDPIDPKYLTEVPFGDRSFWIQPWRAYLDTWPASRLVESLGINFNVRATEAESSAQLLQDSGFKLARLEISWNDFSYEHPTQFVTGSGMPKVLEAMHKHGLRPLILLNANSGGPTPNKNIILTTAAEAAAGAHTVTLTQASAAQVVPGKTGFDQLTFGGRPDILITEVNTAGVATLSRPLASALPAGAHKGATLLYVPFGPPRLTNGQPNPAFEETLDGWLQYVKAVCTQVESVVGAGNYDLEVWNEYSFGSQFLNAENYYSPAREVGTGSVTEELYDRTVAYVRNPANGISFNVGITDGFGSQTPFATGSLLPAGTTAISKHLYRSERSFPAEDKANTIAPVNALGQFDFTNTGTATSRVYTPKFVPTYISLFPEYFLTATQTETVVRDIAPMTTKIYANPHGRNVGTSSGSPTQTWMTEYNIEPSGVTPVGPDETSPAGSTQLSPADDSHLQAKALLRSLVSMIGKGMTREYFYAAANAGVLSIINQNFISAVDAHPNTYPGDEAGGETLMGFRNMLARFQGPGPEGTARQLQLLSIAQESNHAQFAGDGTAGHPSLYDREVLAVLPFQSSPTRFVIPVYVMTRNMATLYEPSAPSDDVDRYDLPDENFRITLGNLPGTSNPPTVSAYDPLRNESTPARLISHQGDRAVFEFAATDYPRLLTIDFGE